MTTAAQHIGGIAKKAWLSRQATRPWQSERPLFQLLATEDISSKRLNNFGLITPVRNTFGQAEKWKWPVSMEAPDSNGGAGGTDFSYARGGAFTFDNHDRYVSGESDTFFYQVPVEVPTTDIDVHAPAAGNENAIEHLVHIMDDYKHKLSQGIATDIAATALVGNRLSPLTVEIDSTGTAAGLAQGTHANWASNETDLSSARLTLRVLAKKIRDMRRDKMAAIDVIVCGAGVHDLLVEESEAKNQPMYDVVQHFGRRSDGSNRLNLEGSHSSIMVEGAPVIVDNFLDTAQAGTVLGMSLKDLMLYSPMADNFEVHGWEDVRLTAAKDATRAQITWSGFLATFNRATHFKYVNAATS